MTTLQAIRKSIRHWVIDIKLPLLRGDYIYYKKSGCISLPVWGSDEKNVLMTVKDCSLCSLFFSDGSIVFCKKCPLKLHGYGCCEPYIQNRNPYIIFHSNPCLATANKMIDTLIEVYRIEKDKKIKHDLKNIICNFGS